MKADSILFLGNSITLTGAYNNWTPDAPCGMAASAADKDYVHLLATSTSARTGSQLRLTPTPDGLGRWYYGDPLPALGDANILNIADIFERNYNTWDNARIQNQIAAKPDIVVLQFGENMEAGGDMVQFKHALEDLCTGLKNSSNPNIFVTSFILGANPPIDAAKQQICDEDPSHRFFVKLQGAGVDCSGVAGHPNDAGMKTIADTLFSSIATHSAPEPSSLALSFTALVAVAWYARRKRK
jgi:hypothetical protein